LYGVPAPVVRKLSSEFFQRIKLTTKQHVIRLCNELLQSGCSEEATIAFDWTFRLRRLYEEADFQLLESWLMMHVHSWGACDDICTHALGAFIYRFPGFAQRTREWARYENRWVRRASAVCLIYAVRRKSLLPEIFDTAGALLIDGDVMVQKGYGWMLKEASNHYPKEVLDYVLRHRREMPRTALRYAIEKLPPEDRIEAMKRT
jgi:3-methyladenine DNA glycosylase AlkD